MHSRGREIVVLLNPWSINEAVSSYCTYFIKQDSKSFGHSTSLELSPDFHLCSNPPLRSILTGTQAL
ncbi:LCLAT1 isoform 4 [Pan troglodytes]|uniref:LCLAT1 isoform 4 n=1 Tax=Pan troglodytes TaxID=9598 RepID=A0A2J8K0J3_PANTR|nr:LCLAT1 isoform 4 [Pan troglodytes]